MDNQICMSVFYFTLMIVSLIATIVYGIYNLQLPGLHQNNQNNQNNQSNQNPQSLLIGAPPIDPDDADDLAFGERPALRRDYRKMTDPLKEPSRRYVNYPGGAIPYGNVNIPTQGYLPSYQIMGYLVNKENGPDRMLKLYGRRIDSYRYEYYAMHHDDPSLKIPLNRQGDKELYDGDKLKVPGYPGKFKVTLYELESPKYIPTLY